MVVFFFKIDSDYVYSLFMTLENALKICCFSQAGLSQNMEHSVTVSSPVQKPLAKYFQYSWVGVYRMQKKKSKKY